MSKKVLLLLAVIFVAGVGLYAQEQNKELAGPKVKLELAWEKEFPDTIFDVGFDPDRNNLSPTWVIEGSFYDARKISYMNEKGKITFTKELKKYSVARISKNGKYVGVLEPEYLTGKEYEPVGPVVIHGKNGKIAHKTRPITGHSFWVSPYGDEVINKTIWVDNWFYSTITNEGVYLDKTENPIYFMGNNLKVISWHNSKKIEDLVAVYDPTSKDNYHKTFTTPGTLYGDNYSSCFLLVLPKRNIFALSTRSENIRLYNPKGEYVKSIDYDVSGRPLFSSQNGRYIQANLRHNLVIYDLDLDIEILNTKMKAKYSKINNNGELLLFDNDSLYFSISQKTDYAVTNMVKMQDKEKIIQARFNSEGKRLCIATNLRLLTFNIIGMKE